MAFFPLNNLRVHKILITSWKSLREPSYLHYLEKQQILALENREGGVSPCLWSLAFLCPQGAIPGLPGPCPSLFSLQRGLGRVLLLLLAGLARLGRACPCEQLAAFRGQPWPRSRNVLLLCYWALIKVRRLFMVRSSKWHLVFW